MSQTLNLAAKGLFYDPNPLSEVPKGALAIADNYVIDSADIADTRRGLTQYGTVLTNIANFLQFGNTLFASTTNQLYYDIDNAGTWTNSPGTFAPANSLLKMRSIEFNQSLYLATATGIQKLATAAGTATPAGVPAALDLNLALTGASGFLADNSAVTYRIVWGYKDVNKLLLLGSPSARVGIENTSGGTRNVVLNFTVPSSVVSGYFYQIYRSEQTLTATDTPSDNLQLVIEKPVSGAEITAKVVTITDTITDDLKGPFIYTAPTQQGILQSNARPPLAVDITEYKQFVMYANTAQPERLNISFILNPTVADTLTIAGLVYTAAVAENIPAREFFVGTDITTTMRSLLKVINRTTGNTLVYGYELNTTTFLIEARLNPGASFTLTGSNTASLSKAVPLTSDPDAHMNRVMISKLSQADAVPLLNYLDFGSASQPIRRIIALQDMVAVIKDDGIYRINGTDLSNFSQEPLDLNTTIAGPNTAVKLDNRIFMMSDAGIAVISITGVNTELGQPIENYLLRLGQLSNFAATAFAVAYESDKKYILAVPTSSSDTDATQEFVFNFKTLSWTRWTKTLSAGIVNHRDDKLYVARATDDQALIERKSYTLDDYADDQFAATISVVDDYEITLSVGSSNAVVGRTLRQGSNYALITDVVGTVVTVDQILPFIAGAAIIYVPIETVLEYTVEDAGNPGLLKQWSEMSWFFRDAAFTTMDLKVKSNFIRGYRSTPLTAEALGGWGDDPWGDSPWGSGVGGFQPIRTYFPKEMTRAAWVSLRIDLGQAFTKISLAGVSIICNAMSSRFR